MHTDYLSLEEAIKILNEAGIQVTYVPRAIVPIFDGGKRIGHGEVDVYEVLRKVRNRSAIARDPFSETVN